MKRATGKSNIDIVKDYLAGERPFVQVGYKGDNDKHRKEGERWTDTDGIQWQKLNGKSVRLTKTQGQIIRDTIGDTLDCKVCKAKWKWSGSKDRRMLNRTGLCSDCLIEYETKLRIVGAYDVYEKYRMGIYEMGHLKELRLKIKETIANLEHTGGDVTKLAESEYDTPIVWKNTNKDTEIENCKKDLANVDELISKGGPILEDLKKSYVEAVKNYKLQDIFS